MRAAKPLRSSCRSSSAPGPYCASTRSMRMICAAARLNPSLTASNELFADAISRPSTSADSVAIRPVTTFTTSFESALM